MNYNHFKPADLIYTVLNRGYRNLKRYVHSAFILAFIFLILKGRAQWLSSRVLDLRKMLVHCSFLEHNTLSFAYYWFNPGNGNIAKN